MRIMVFDVPAESGGALTILNQYYDAAVKDKDNEWVFVVSTPKLKESYNVKVLNYPWIKKNWIHRLYFDEFTAHKLVKKYDADEVLSLQNVIVSKVNVMQTLYLHQPLPFSEKKYSMTENLKFWVYQNVISKMIFKSIKKADKVIVQTKWIRDAAIKKTGANREKFIIEQPKIDINIKKTYSSENTSEKIFFYPASGLEYKNHKIIIDACKQLVHENIKNYKVIFTLEGHENKDIKKLYDISKTHDLPIDFIGVIDIDRVYEYYSKSTLIFPSYIETFGLPLLEARMHNSPILASDCQFSIEVLNGYSKATFFNPFKSDDLFKKMLNVIGGKAYD